MLRAAPPGTRPRQRVSISSTHAVGRVGGASVPCCLSGDPTNPNLPAYAIPLETSLSSFANAMCERWRVGCSQRTESHRLKRGIDTTHVRSSCRHSVLHRSALGSKRELCEGIVGHRVRAAVVALTSQGMPISGSPRAICPRSTTPRSSRQCPATAPMTPATADSSAPDRQKPCEHALCARSRTAATSPVVLVRADQCADRPRRKVLSANHRATRSTHRRSGQRLLVTRTMMRFARDGRRLSQRRR